MSTSLRSVTIGIWLQIRFENWLQHQLRGGLHRPVPYGWDTERPLTASGLRDQHPSHRSVVEKFRDKYWVKDVTKYYSKFDVAVVVALS